MAERRLFLGVDGGQSATKAVIGDGSGAVLARSTAGPCNHASGAEGESRLRAAIHAVVRDAVAAATLPPESRFEAACLGMSGGPDDKRGILAEIVPAEAIHVVSDVEVALEGAAEQPPAVIVVAGTGAIALAKRRDGRTARCGGWGYAFGDEGGAFDIVRQAMRSALAADEGWGAPTVLGGALVQATGADSTLEALHRFYEPAWPRDRVASLAPVIDELAAAGDSQARRIMETSGTMLATLASRAVEALDGCADGWPVYPTGGVFRSKLVRAAFQRRCAADMHWLEAPAHDGAVGALLLAYRGAGLNLRIRDLP